MKSFPSLEEALSDLRQKGYLSDFESDSFCLYCGDLDMRLDPEEFKVDEMYKVIATGTMEKSAMIYAITSISGIRGIVTERTGSCSLK